MVSRRSFVRRSAAAAVGMGLVSGHAAAPESPHGPLGRPIGLQLYTVREQAEADLPGTLNALGAMGYREVELAGLHGRSAPEFARLLQEAGLDARAAHYNMFDLQGDLVPALDDLSVLGVTYLVCSVPGAPDPERLARDPGGPGRAILNGALTLDEWRWNAEQLNRVGAAAQAAGMRFAYHNHAMEFRDYQGTVAFEELLRLTDPDRVSLEVDCAWVAAGGQAPAAVIERHRPRVRLLHIKDVKDQSDFATTEVGSGTIDWRAVFAAVDAERLDHYFVEQEHFADLPPLEAAAASLKYLSALG
jgi:sugar phosphate isomerase/epimerase